jgi:hypothetical protein
MINTTIRDDGEAATMETKRDIEKFIDEIKYGRMTRRKFARAMASVGLAVALMPTGRTKALAEDSGPTVFAWTGDDAPEMHAESDKKDGKAPNLAIWGDEEEAESTMR